MALQHRAVLHLPQPALHTGSRLAGNSVLPRPDAVHIDGHDGAADLNSVVRRTTRYVGGVRAGNHGLGRDTAGVYARSAEQIALDYGYLHPGGREARGEERARLSRAYYCCVAPLGRHTRETIQNVARTAIA